MFYVLFFRPKSHVTDEKSQQNGPPFEAGENIHFKSQKRAVHTRDSNISTLCQPRPPRIFSLQEEKFFKLLWRRGLYYAIFHYSCRNIAHTYITKNFLRIL